MMHRVDERCMYTYVVDVHVVDVARAAGHQKCDQKYARRWFQELRGPFIR